MVREVVLDTETTGFEPDEGHRLVEIGCLELENHLPTGNTFHVYINPHRDMPQPAFKVHGLSSRFLADKPDFKDVADDFLEFIGPSPLIIHNAAFDLKFLSAELKAIGYKEIPLKRAVDTLLIAREKFPGARNNLDALCGRFDIDNSNRTIHGALLDSELLAEVYMALLGGRQQGFSLDVEPFETLLDDSVGPSFQQRPFRTARSFSASSEELEAHRLFMERLTAPLWNR